jgi:phosphoribosylformylglycinamidine synthase
VHRDAFEALFKGLPCGYVGLVTETPVVEITGVNHNPIVSLPVSALKSAWKRPFGDLI